MKCKERKELRGKTLRMSYKWNTSKGYITDEISRKMSEIAIDKNTQKCSKAKESRR